MSRQSNYIDTPGNLSSTHGFVHDRVKLIKEIGRLRVELHHVKFLDNSEKRSDFLRKEISTLKLQLNTLRVHARRN